MHAEGENAATRLRAFDEHGFGNPLPNLSAFQLAGVRMIIAPLARECRRNVNAMTGNQGPRYLEIKRFIILWPHRRPPPFRQ